MISSRNLLLAIAAACFAMLGAGMYIQHVVGLLPCPLCVIQRYLFLGIAAGCLLGAFMDRPKLGAGLGLLSALGGVGVAVKHLYVLAHPGLSCGIDPLETSLNKIFTAEYLPFMFQADGLCEDATEPFFGMPIPQWALVWFVIYSLALIWVLARRRK
ncbi:MAG: disulfide bond formation protein B [Burkholderiaceae bacterium]|nr:disulfide bond formation protein B [Burkholderiaceae bacterium]